MAKKKSKKNEKTVIIGGGPAGLTAGYELEKRGFSTEMYEKSGSHGGLAKTVKFNGHKIDIGPHRFFSKDDRVMKWWAHRLPIYSPDGNVMISYQNKSREADEDLVTDELTEDVMLVVDRQTRILFNGNFYDYPIKLSMQTLKKFGYLKTVSIGIKYVLARIFPRKEVTLEDFFINKFGKDLYEMFFKTYTEKVWGVKPENINADWGAQRVKGVSISAVLKDAIKKGLTGDSSLDEQKSGETSLIEKFIYPKHGAGHMWDRALEDYQAEGGNLSYNSEIVKVHHDEENITELEIKNNLTDEITKVKTDRVLSTMPVTELLEALEPSPPQEVLDVSRELKFRNMAIVILVLKRLLGENGESENLIKDNWIYVHDKDVQMGRMQIVNNLSKYMLKDSTNVVVGLEYFCDEGDEMWNTENKRIANMGVKECMHLGLIEKGDVLEAKVIKVRKAYPSYIDGYENFEVIRDYFNDFDNLYLIGRNGMHRYNNMDHSMIAAFEAVDSIEQGLPMNDTIWDVNTEKDYHEIKENEAEGENVSEDESTIEGNA